MSSGLIRPAVPRAPAEPAKITDEAERALQQELVIAVLHADAAPKDEARQKGAGVLRARLLRARLELAGRPVAK